VSIFISFVGGYEVVQQGAQASGTTRRVVCADRDRRDMEVLHCTHTPCVTHRVSVQQTE